MAEAKKRLLSGVKPTGRPHIGNYFGAMKQFVDLQNSGQYDSFIFVADYHALNFIQNATEMRGLIVDLVKDYIAIGLNPKKTFFYKQSDISEHTELTWIFDTITTMAYLTRAHAFKAALEKYTDAHPAQRLLIHKLEQIPEIPEINVGLFNYPMLMAADILLYDPDVVPVGQDQKQHIEFTRDTAEKFNRLFGSTFKLPEGLILDTVAIVKGTDGRKMSKSYGNTIPLFGSRDELAEAVMTIVTDSGPDEEIKNLAEAGIASGSFLRPMNLYRIHSLIKSKEELLDLYSNNQNNYKAIKEALIEDLDALLAPMRERRNGISEKEVQKILAEGAAKAKEIASKKMEEVRTKIGVR